jgi:hypothetical protein
MVSELVKAVWRKSFSAREIEAAPRSEGLDGRDAMFASNWERGVQRIARYWLSEISTPLNHRVREPVRAQSPSFYLKTETFCECKIRKSSSRSSSK